MAVEPHICDFRRWVLFHNRVVPVCDEGSDSIECERTGGGRSPVLRPYGDQRNLHEIAMKESRMARDWRKSVQWKDLFITALHPSHSGGHVLYPKLNQLLQETVLRCVDRASLCFLLQRSPWPSRYSARRLLSKALG